MPAAEEAAGGESARHPSLPLSPPLSPAGSGSLVGVPGAAPPSGIRTGQEGSGAYRLLSPDPPRASEYSQSPHPQDQRVTGGGGPWTQRSRS